MPAANSTTLDISRHHSARECAMPGSRGGCVQLRINIGTQLSETEPLVSTLVGIRTHDKNTNLQIAAGSGSIGWHGLGSARYIWRTSDRVVECHTFACSEHPIVISGT